MVLITIKQRGRAESSLAPLINMPSKRYKKALEVVFDPTGKVTKEEKQEEKKDEKKPTKKDEN